MDTQERISRLEKKSQLYQSLFVIGFVAFVVLSASMCSDSGGGGADAQQATTIPASNVLINTNNNNLNSNNLQSALDDEMEVDLSTTLVGTWNIENITNDETHGPAGVIIIRDNGTYDLVSGFFSAAGQGDGSLGFCDHIESSQVWREVINQVFEFAHSNGGSPNAVIPLVLEAQRDRIAFLGSGGCGAAGAQRLSVLTRVP